MLRRRFGTIDVRLLSFGLIGLDLIDCDLIGLDLIGCDLIDCDLISSAFARGFSSETGGKRTSTGFARQLVPMLPTGAAALKHAQLRKNRALRGVRGALNSVKRLLTGKGLDYLARVPVPRRC
jgi:Pentapeptide repeats (8 copies)